jgi:acyl transferase domain-containing protein
MVTCALPAQISALSIKLAGGVSSFGYSGTIAHAVLNLLSDSDEPCVLMPLAYCRYAFLWRLQPHPLLQCRLAASNYADVFTSPVMGALLAIISDHVVQGRVIFPGAGYLEMARAASAAALRDVFFLQPLAVDAAGYVECAVEDRCFEVRYRTHNEASRNETVYCSGSTVSDNRDGSKQRVEYVLTRGLRNPFIADVNALYNGFAAVGLQYGPAYRTLAQTWSGTTSAGAQLRSQPSAGVTWLHPALLDDALCVSTLIMGSNRTETRLPFAVEEAWLQNAAGDVWTVCRQVIRCGNHPTD